MSTFYEKHKPEQLPPDELSEREKQILHAHLDQQLVAKWKRLVGAPPSSLQNFLGKKKWVLVVAALLLGALAYWQLSQSKAVEKTAHPVMAARTDMVEYPFENSNVRGENDHQKPALPAKALDAYRKKDFETAIREADPADHFFVGVCWLLQKNAAKALSEFEASEATGMLIGDEFFYYKGVALQESGRPQEAKQAFKRVLESKTLRDNFRADAAKRMGD